MIIRPESKEKVIMLAPMAGITDKPFRRLCRRMGAHACVSEMITSDINLYRTQKSRFRRDLADEEPPVIVQIAGADPGRMAEAAVMNIENGADVIDINMGCPAKKVCNVMAGSSLLREPGLVKKILRSVVDVATVPVTLKIRTGWDKYSKNALEIAKIAEQYGVQRLTVHGRTRACGFSGVVEHHTVAEVKASVGIQVIANGDIQSVEDVRTVLNETGADGVMIGRASMGNPWLFKQVRHFLETGEIPAMPEPHEIEGVVDLHLREIHEHYGDYLGVRIARKHIYQYCGKFPEFENFRVRICRVSDAELQILMVRDFIRSQFDVSLAA
ncbi:MAG: tRNA dihydrouridine synthase DusB [Gammaproteobacteria bacterium]|nr:tRNA dihydrouridine synthase DusB [Gammaproteobacteria bacterium]